MIYRLGYKFVNRLMQDCEEGWNQTKDMRMIHPLMKIKI